MNTRTRIICLLVIVAALLGIWSSNSRFDYTPAERPSLVQVIQRVDPSVVYVEAYTNAYGDEGYKLWSGSGVVIDPGGLVLTAAHVVKDADKFKVTLPDGREFWSESSWHRSEISDVGFIQLADVNDKLPISYLGKSSDLRKGEDVFIIGCPFGYSLRFTVTQGIVSGLGRDRGGYYGKKLMLQVDAMSWGGNSGGPVYDMLGQIIGILVGGPRGTEGVSICVPVDIISGILGIYEAERYVESIE